MASNQFYELLQRGTIEGLEPDAIVGTSLAVSGNATVGGTLGVTGGVTANLTGDVTGRVIGSVQNLSGAGAVNLTTLTTVLTTTGANALTLADGTAGQMKVVVMAVDGGDGTLTPTTKTGYTSITFNDAGDAVVLQFFTTLGWMIVANYGATINA